MDTEAPKEKKQRTVTPRSATHQAVLDATHEWLKKPFADNREKVFAAMLAHKRAAFAPDEINSL